MNVRGLCLSEKLPCVDNLDYCNEFGKEVCDQKFVDGLNINKPYICV